MVRTGPVTGVIAQIVLLAALAGTVGMSVTGWLAGVVCGLIKNTTLQQGLARSSTLALGPANRVTLARATLVGGVSALVAESFARPAAVTTMVVGAGDRRGAVRIRGSGLVPAMAARADAAALLV